MKATDDLIEEATSALDEKEAETVSAAAPSEKKKPKKANKPAWAKTEKQTEENKEAEIDDLLEFAYELDYE